MNYVVSQLVGQNASKSVNQPPSLSFSSPFTLLFTVEIYVFLPPTLLQYGPRDALLVEQKMKIGTSLKCPKKTSLMRIFDFLIAPALDKAE